VRICFIAPGPGPQINNIISFFLQEGHEISLIINGEDNIPGVKVYDMSYKRRKRLISFLQQVKFVKNVIRDARPDIVHSNFLTGCGYLGVFSGFHPHVVSLWGSDILVIPRHSLKNRILTKYTLSKADLITGNSEQILQEAVQLGADNRKIRKCRNPVRLDVFRPDLNTDSLRQNLNIENRKVILSNRAFYPLYNLDIVVKAIPLILKERKDVVFVFANSGSGEEKIKRLVRELKIEEAARFIGKIDNKEMAYYLCASNAFVSVPSSDSGPVSLYEAMACGIPPVVSNVSAVCERVKDGVNGYVVPVKDYISLSRAVLKILEGGDIINKFRERNFELVKREADYRTEMTKLKQYYLELIDKSFLK
jgi:glycosyltransferase involved in cell wall biosynthesis